MVVVCVQLPLATAAHIHRFSLCGVLPAVLHTSRFSQSRQGQFSRSPAEDPDISGPRLVCGQIAYLNTRSIQRSVGNCRVRAREWLVPDIHDPAPAGRMVR